MIADGVLVGTLEAYGKGSRTGRPWVAKAEGKRTDWVADIARIAQRPGAGSLAPIRVAEPVMDTATFRDLIAKGRAEAVAHSRMN